MKTNFDTSSTGISIEADISYDFYLSRMNFEKYIDYENIPEDVGVYNPKYVGVYDEEFIPAIDIKAYKVKKADLVEACEEFAPYYGDYESMTKDELVDELLNMSIYDLEPKRWTRNKSIHDFLNVETNYKIHYSTGYSQGELTQVFYSDDLEDSITKFIDHLYWDSLVYARIDINGEENYLEDIHGCYMEWNEGYEKEKAINELVKLNPELDEELLRGELEEVLPDEVEYPQ